MKNGKNDRRSSALARLEAQLKSGKKTEKKTGATVDLSDGDKKRIQNEITILKARV